MPIYEYRCEKCHQIFEEWTKQAGDETPRVCPICKSPAERIMSNTSFVLKGGGWYVTDYGFKSKEKLGNSEAASSGSSDSSPSAPAPAASPAPSSNTGAA